MADNAAAATELADDDIITESNEAPKAAETPVRNAFGAGVLGGPLPSVPIPQNDPNARPDPVPLKHEGPPIDLAREAAMQLDQARGFAAEIARIQTDTALRLLGAADPLMEKIDAVMSRIDVTKLDVERAVAEAVRPIRTFPHLDEETRTKVIASATEQARADLLTERGKELEALAVEVVAMGEHLAKQLDFEEAFADDELRTALDGQRDPRERASEDYLVSRFNGQSVAEVAKAYDLMQLDPDRDRVRRFERAALKDLDAKVTKYDQDIAQGLTKDQSEEWLNWVKAEKKAAVKLRDRLRAQRATRTPKSIVHGKAMLANLKEAWQRLAGVDHRSGAGVESAAEANARRNDDSKLAASRAAAKSWKPLEGWHGRHFRKSK